MDEEVLDLFPAPATPEANVPALPPRDEAVMAAIRQSIDTASLAYTFGASSYAMSALTAAMAVSEAYLRATAAPPAPADGDGGEIRPGRRSRRLWGVQTATRR
jgi:hypothetical protein